MKQLKMKQQNKKVDSLECIKTLGASLLEKLLAGKGAHVHNRISW